MRFATLLVPVLTAAFTSSSRAAEPEELPLLLVLNKSEASMSILHGTSGETLATLATGAGPHEIAVSPDGRTGVVANYGQATPGDTLGVYDLVERELVRTIELGEHRRPHGLEFDADGDLFVTTEDSRSILRVDVETGSIEAVMRTNRNVSHMLVVSPTAPRVFVSSIGSGTLTVFDTETGELLADLETGAGAEGLDITPDGREVWVGNRAADTITVVDAETLEIVDQLPCASFPIRVKFTPEGTHALVSNARSGELAVFDVLSRQEVRRIPMKVEASEDDEGRLFGGSFQGSPVPVGILVRPDGEVAFVANTNADVISVVSLTDWKVIDRFRAGREPDGLGWTTVPPAKSSDGTR